MIPHPSPNCGPRRHGGPPDMVVLHYTAMNSCAAALDRLCDLNAEVSAHYMISEQGETYVLVPEDQRAWHAGAGAWGGVTDVNSHSIGIELVNAGSLRDHPPFPHPQMRALEDLLHGITTRWSIPPERIIAHSDMAPGRKSDPGPKFDWRGLAHLGLSVWPETEDAMADFQSSAKTFGYRPLTDDAAGWLDVLASFRLRFCPGTKGPLCDRDWAMAHNLARRWPCAPLDPSSHNS